MARRVALASMAISIILTLAVDASARDTEGEDEAAANAQPVRRPPPPVVVISPPPPVAAPPEPEEAPPPPRKLDNGGFELTLGAVTFSPVLSSTRFTGSAKPPGGMQNVTFSHEGRELGLRSPRFYGGELRFAYLRRYFAVGLLGFYAGGASVDAPPTNRADAELVDARSLVAFGGALDASGALPVGPVTFRLGGAAGLRGYSIALSGFEPGVCTRRSRSTGSTRYPCAETAKTNAQPFVMPRAQIDVALDRKKNFFLGAYAGVDVLADAQPAFGLVLGFRAPHDDLLP